MNRPESNPIAGRKVKEITVKFADGGEPMTLTHEGEGEAVNALVWDKALMEKLRYEEAGQPQGRCTKPEIRPGKGWKKRGKPAAGGTGSDAGGETMMMASNGGDPECVWVHQNSCTWAKICDDM